MAGALLAGSAEPGPLLGWLEHAGLPLRPVDSPEAIPADDDPLVVLGGRGDPDLARALRTALEAGVAVLGVGDGGFALAEAAGARAGPAEGIRPGPGLVRKADAAARDPVFAPLPFLPDVLRWSPDLLTEPPPGATVLAAGVPDPYAALRLGERGYALSFHVDTTASMLAAWAEAEGWDPAPLLAELDAAELESTWRPVAAAFATLATGR